MNVNGPFLIFDSGLGGLSIVSAIKNVLPRAQIAYVCDNAMLPYGRKEDDWLIKRVLDVCSSSVEACSPSVLVLACNTASTLVLDTLRKYFKMPVVGTVPAIKPAALVTKSNKIALLATSATVKRPYTQRLIDIYASHCDVVKIPADSLVYQVEKMLSGDYISHEIIKECLGEVVCNDEIDTIVLGCTHFPMIVETLKKVIPREVNWIDSGAGVAKRVSAIAGNVGFNTSVVPGPSFSTANDQKLSSVLVEHGFSAPLVLSIDSLNMKKKVNIY